LSWTSRRIIYDSKTEANISIAVPVSQNLVRSINSECGCGAADNGIGFAGNDAPSFVFPTAIASKSGAGGAATGSGRPAVANKPSFLTGGAQGSNVAAKRGTEDLDFFIGDEALAAGNNPGYGIRYPVRHGQVENWDDMERFWSNSIFKYLRVEPEDHYFLLTEPVSTLR
jgi:actin-related protein 3